MPDAPAKLQTTYDALVEGFVMPLVEGGEVHLGRPVGPGCAAFFADAVPTSEDVRHRIYGALVRQADEITGLDRVPFPGFAITALAAAAHNLMAVTDPALDRVFARGARNTILAWTDRWLELMPLPATRGDAVARHVLLEPILALRRKDTVVKNWAYTYRFFGRSVPGNVTALPTIRFVKTFETLTELRGFFSSEKSDPKLALADRHRTLVSRSPITELLHAHELGDFRFGLALLHCLADDALRSGLARQVAQREEELLPYVGAALAVPSLRATPPLLAVALRFVIEVHLVLALDGAMRPPSSLAGGAALASAVLLGALENDAALEVFRTLDDDDRAALQRRAEALRGVVLDDAKEMASALLRAASG
jgi:hypothetical protein